MNKKRWIQLKVKCLRFLKGLKMRAVMNRFKNFRASSTDYERDDEDTNDGGTVRRVDMDKVLDELNPFGWFQVRD